MGKRRLYWVIDMYLSEKINEPAFCNEFYYSYDLELDHSTLTPEEKKAFYELGEVAGRFSEFEEDHQNAPGAFFTKEELRNKILETKSVLKGLFPQTETDVQ